MGRYVQVEDITNILTQMDGDLDKEALLGTFIDAAESIVDGVLGFTYAGYTSGTVRRLYFPPSPIAHLPPHAIGSVTLVSDHAGNDLAALWEETPQGQLVALQPSFALGHAIWIAGPYNVTADWGVGPVPASVQQVVKELVVNMERGAVRGGYTEIVGVEGSGGLRHISGLTTSHRAILDAARRDVLRFSGITV